jgi:hypothetical protein
MKVLAALGATLAALTVAVAPAAALDEGCRTGTATPTSG